LETIPERGKLKAWLRRASLVQTEQQDAHLFSKQLLCPRPGMVSSIKGALADRRDSSLLGFLSIEAVHCRRPFGYRRSIVCGEILFE